MPCFCKPPVWFGRQSGPTPCVSYVIGGPIYQTDGSQYTQVELEAMTAQLGLTGRLGFVGFQQDPRARLSRP